MAVAKRRALRLQQPLLGTRPALSFPDGDLRHLKSQGFSSLHRHRWQDAEGTFGSDKAPTKEAILVWPLEVGVAVELWCSQHYSAAWDCTKRESSFLFNLWCRINPKWIVLMKGSVDMCFDLGGLLLDLFGVWVIKTSRLADLAIVMTLIWPLYCSILNPLVRLEQVNLSEMFA